MKQTHNWWAGRTPTFRLWTDETGAANYGFTGTRLGMTAPQAGALYAKMSTLHPDSFFHHGRCFGSDEEAHAIAQALGLRAVLHNPDNQKFMALCPAPYAMSEPMPYLDRNVAIAMAATAGLFAAPKAMFEELRSGTWTTVRCARKHHRPIWIVWPDGSVSEERHRPRLPRG